MTDNNLIHSASNLLKTGKYQAAYQQFNALDQRYSDNKYEIKYGLGLCLFGLEQYSDALIYFKQALEINNHDPELYNSIASCYRRMGQPSVAKNQLLAAEYTCSKKIPRTLTNLSAILHLNGDFKFGKLLNQEAYRRDPHFYHAKWQLAMDMLRNRDYENGFKLYESRFEMNPKAVGIEKINKRWDGRKSSLIVLKEQGIGDCIQMMRYISPLKKRVSKLAVQLPKALVDLAKINYPDVEFFSESSMVSEYEFEIPAMSLPGIMGFEESFADHGYLDFQNNGSFKQDLDLSSLAGKKVAVVWAGNPAHHNDKNRSQPIENFAKVLKGVAANIIIMQVPFVVEAEKQFSPANGYQVVNLANKIQSWTDTATLLKQVDLLLTVDTSVAHLAGAMGVKTMMTIPVSPDWRWGLEGVKNSWYNSILLYRQRQSGEWSDLLEVLRMDVAHFIETGIFRSTDRFVKEIMQYKKTLLEKNKVVEKSVSNPSYWLLLGKNNFKEKKYENAISALLCSVSIEPCMESIYWLIKSYHALGSHQLAYEVGLVGLEMNPDDTDISLETAKAAYDGGMPEVAAKIFKSQTEAYPETPRHWTNLGFTLKESGYFDEALRAYNKAIALTPNDSALKWNASHLNLLLNNDSIGIELYESRWNVAGFTTKKRSYEDREEWLGQNIHQKRLLIYHEQGLGDVIQIARYFYLVEKVCASLVIDVVPEMLDLMNASKGSLGLSEKTVFVSGVNAEVGFDAYVPAMSLPKCLGIHSFSKPPKASGYLSAVPRIQSRLDSNGEIIPLKVGLVWKGRPTHPHDSRRSFSLSNLESLLGLPGVKFFSLQQRLTIEEEKLLDKYQIMNIVDYSKNLNEVAGVIKGLDLLISTDSSLAHIAAALGVPVWIGVAYVPDFRWGLNSTSTKWYDSATLYRQKSLGDWSSVFVEMEKDLISKVKVNCLS